MNVLIFTSEQAELLISQQEGRHRLAPLQLTDGRYFLHAEILDEPLYAGKLDNVDFSIEPFENIQNLLNILNESEN